MKEKRVPIAIALISALVLVLWLLPDDSTRPEEASGGPEAAAAPATAPGPKPPAARDKAHRHEATLRSFKGLAAAIPGEAMVLRCKLSASLDPERDLFVPGRLECLGTASLPFAYEDGWFTTVVTAPSGAGALCQDHQPEDGLELDWKDAVTGCNMGRAGLNWTGAGTHSASCQVGECRTNTLRGVVSGPESTEGGSPINYVVWPLNNFPLRVQDDGTYSGEVIYIHDGAQPTLGRVQLQAMTKTESGGLSFWVGSTEVRLAPTLEAVADFEVTPANIAAGLDPDTVLHTENMSDGIFIMDMGPLLAKASPDNPEYALLKRMDRDRTAVKEHAEDAAWENYDHFREIWIEDYRKANEWTEDKASEAFDEHWQSILDFEDNGGSQVDAAGMQLGPNGNPIGANAGLAERYLHLYQQRKERWSNQYLETNGGSPAEAAEAYRKSRQRTTEE